MTTFQQLPPEKLADIDRAMTKHCLALSQKMASPTLERHEFWVQSLLFSCDWDAVQNTFGDNNPLEGYPTEIYDENCSYTHFVGENNCAKFFAQKRDKGWCLFIVDEIGDVLFRQIRYPDVYMGKLGWDRQ